MSQFSAETRANFADVIALQQRNKETPRGQHRWNSAGAFLHPRRTCQLFIRAAVGGHSAGQQRRFSRNPELYRSQRQAGIRCGLGPGSRSRATGLAVTYGHSPTCAGQRSGNLHRFRWREFGHRLASLALFSVDRGRVRLRLLLYFYGRPDFEDCREFGVQRDNPVAQGNQFDSFEGVTIPNSAFGILV